MKRISRWSALAGAVIAALFLMSFMPISNAQPYGIYAGGGYGPGYGGYSAYGQGPYAYGSRAGFYYPAYRPSAYQGYGAGRYGYGAPPIRGYSPYRAYSPYNMSLYGSPYDNPYFYPYGLRTYTPRPLGY
jgi:hypothetical protein